VEAPKEPEIALEKRTVYFDFDKADLREDAIATLDALVAIIQQDGAITKAITIGYTDLMGADEYNMKLSQSRAEAVQAYLASKLNIPTETGEVRGLGVSKTAECEAVKTRTKRIDCLGPDRRVEIEMTYQK
jgi:OOP family OmpA-OmpF porin